MKNIQQRNCIPTEKPTAGEIRAQRFTEQIKSTGAKQNKSLLVGGKYLTQEYHTFGPTERGNQLVKYVEALGKGRNRCIPSERTKTVNEQVDSATASHCHVQQTAEPRPARVNRMATPPEREISKRNGRSGSGGHRAYYLSGKHRTGHGRPARY